MPSMLKGLVFVAAIAFAAAPAWAAGMPDFGTKNFSPDLATPAYFSNENGGGDAETVYDGADDTAARPVDRVAAPHYAEGAAQHHHGEAVGRRNAGHSAAYSRLRERGGWSSTTNSAANHGSFAVRTRTGVAGSAAGAKSHMRHASARQSAHRG